MKARWERSYVAERWVGRGDTSPQQLAHLTRNEAETAANIQRELDRIVAEVTERPTCPNRHDEEE